MEGAEASVYTYCVASVFARALERGTLEHMQKVAFFDIDGTVFRSSLLIELVEACITEGIFPQKAKGGYEKEQEAWRNRDGTYEAYADALIVAFMEHIKGVHYGDFVDIGRRVVAVQGRRTYRYTRDLIADLQSKDYYLVAISQSPKMVLDEFCASYGFNKVYGRMYEIGPLDRFTGIVTDAELMQDKALVVERVVTKENLSRVGSIAVGDTEGDISMLSAVEMPICFNPNRTLYEYAQGKKWPIVVERKDVLYTI